MISSNSVGPSCARFEVRADVEAAMIGQSRSNAESNITEYCP